jgi:diguanylate cyclase
MVHDEDMVRMAARLARSAGVDEATGLSNVRQFLREVQRELARARRRHEHLVVLVVEPDRPMAVREVVEVVEELVREEDLLARLGETRLGVLLVSTAPHAGRLVANRIQRNLARLGPVSVGVRPVIPDLDVPLSAAELLRQAARALAEARACGGNLLVAWGDVILQTN